MLHMRNGELESPIWTQAAYNLSTSRLKMLCVCSNANKEGGFSVSALKNMYVINLGFGGQFSCVLCAQK